MARVVQGTNAVREFKHGGADNRLTVRPLRRTRPAELLAPALDVTTAREAADPEMDADSARKAVVTPIGAAAASGPRPASAPPRKARRREIAVELDGMTDSSEEAGLR